MAFGPDRLPAAIVLTFDNLGEASELERGIWPADARAASHPSVTVALPRLLDELDAHKLTATFFVEAINCELYPGAVREIAARGHELGIHGWRHEQWDALAPARESELLTRSRRAFAALGIDATGFRPPGGALTARSPEPLRAAGITWCSPVGSSPRVCCGLAYVPFAWQHVDAYHLMARFAQLRRASGDGAEPVAPATLARRLIASLEDAALGERALTVILHPFLMLDEEWFAGVRQLLARLAALAHERRAWVGPGGAFADLARPRGGAPAGA